MTTIACDTHRRLNREHAEVQARDDGAVLLVKLTQKMSAKGTIYLSGWARPVWWASWHQTSTSTVTSVERLRRRAGQASMTYVILDDPPEGEPPPKLLMSDFAAKMLSLETHGSPLWLVDRAMLMLEMGRRATARAAEKAADAPPAATWSVPGAPRGAWYHSRGSRGSPAAPCAGLDASWPRRLLHVLLCQPNHPVAR